MNADPLSHHRPHPIRTLRPRARGPCSGPSVQAPASRTVKHSWVISGVGAWERVTGRGGEATEPGSSGNLGSVLCPHGTESVMRSHASPVKLRGCASILRTLGAIDNHEGKRNTVLFRDLNISQELLRRATDWNGVMRTGRHREVEFWPKSQSW